MIDWESDATHVVLNPRLPAGEQTRLERLVAGTSLASHVWLASSGRSGERKLIALSKTALLASAASVNRHLDASSEDVWCKPLPSFHVGGLGIEARASLSGSRVVELDVWNAEKFVALCERSDVSLASLVPTQVWDLVDARLKPSARMRAIVVGGAAMPSALYQRSRELGWPLLPSYGMTECASQIATASLQSLDAKLDDLPPLFLLSHLRARREPDGRLAFAGTSLLTLYLIERDGSVVFEDPKQDGWFTSDDYGTLLMHEGVTVLDVAGRAGDFIKIGGEAVYLSRLDEVLDGIVRASDLPDAAVFSHPDERLGTVIHLAVATADPASARRVRDLFAQSVLPYERPRRLFMASSIPRSALGKLLRERLVEELQTGSGATEVRQS